MGSYKVWSYTASHPYHPPLEFFRTRSTRVTDGIQFAKKFKATEFEGVIRLCPMCRHETLVTEEEVSTSAHMPCDKCKREQKALPP